MKILPGKTVFNSCTRPIRIRKLIRMSHRIHYWKQFTVSLLLVFAFQSCQKQKFNQEPEASPPPPEESIYQALLDPHIVPVFTTAYTTDLKIRTGENIGTVTVANDATDLYLTYRLSGNWFLTGVQSYAGKKSLIPLTGSGSPNPGQFPAKLNLNACDKYQSFTFKVSLSELNSDESAQCTSGSQYFIAMRASIREIETGDDCTMGNNQESWAAPVLINPADADEWATAFYYCRQEVKTWRGYGQGYWFAKPNVEWCQPYVQFGNLSIGKDEAKALWPAQNNILKKALFQASALQLSTICNNNGDPVPSVIENDYQMLIEFLSGLSYSDIQNGTLPAGTDANAIAQAASNIGKFICQNKLNAAEDPTDCTF